MVSAKPKVGQESGGEVQKGEEKASEASEASEASSTGGGFSVDGVLAHLGVWGKFQARFWFCISYNVLFPTAALLSYTFIAALPKHRCFIPGCDDEESPQFDAAWLNGTYIGDHVALIKCHRYETDVTYHEGQCSANQVTNKTSANVQCDRWVYDQSTFVNTASTDFNFVCDDAWKQTFISSLTMAGVMVGSLTIGSMVDIIGRRRAYMVLSVWFFSFAMGSAFSPNYETFAALRFLTGYGGIVLQQANLIWGMEMMLPHMRVPFIFCVYLSQTLGNILVGLIAYYIREWRYVQVTIFAPMALIMLVPLILPESPRWFMSKNRAEEARDVLVRGAKMNGVTIPDHLLVLPEPPGGTATVATAAPAAQSPWLVLRTPFLMKNLIILFLAWLSGMLCYFGLSLSAGHLGEDIFLNYELIIFVEIPAYVIGIFTINRVGRRIILNITLIGAGSFCIAAGVVPEDQQSVVLACYLLGKFFISLQIVAVMMITSELFPTFVRGTAIGMCTTVGKLGAVISPILAALGENNRSLPYLIFGSSALIAGFVSLLLPETTGQQMPSTIEDARQLEKNRMSIPRCRRRTKFSLPTTIKDS